MAKFAREDLKARRRWRSSRDVRQRLLAWASPSTSSRSSRSSAATIVDDAELQRRATRTSRRSSPPSRRKAPRPSTCPATTPTSPSSRARRASSASSVPLLGGDGWDSREALRDRRQGPRAAPTTRTTTPPTTRPAHPGLRGRPTRRASAATPDGLAALGYDAAMVAFDAMSSARRTLVGAGAARRHRRDEGLPGVTGTSRSTRTATPRSPPWCSR